MRKIVLDYLMAHDVSKDATIESIVNEASDDALKAAMRAIELAASNGIILDILKNE